MVNVAKDEVRTFAVVAAFMLCIVSALTVASYQMGYADARRADRPLLAPPTKAERAR
jgi:hypothetical protein